jgi:hypothetical protein
MILRATIENVQIISNVGTFFGHEGVRQSERSRDDVHDNSHHCFVALQYGGGGTARSHV